MKVRSLSKYELIYGVAAERALVRLRTSFRHEQVHLCGLRAPLPRVRAQ